MELKEFIMKFICPNSIIRLWVPIDGGHKMLCENNIEVCMEWEILKGTVWQSKYIDCKVVGVTDIVVETCKESINIVLQK